MVAGACSPSYLGGWGMRIAWPGEVEVAVSQDPTTALQPRQQEWNSVSKTKQNEKDNIFVRVMALRPHNKRPCLKTKQTNEKPFQNGWNSEGILCCAPPFLSSALVRAEIHKCHCGCPHHITLQVIIVSTMVPVAERTSAILTHHQYSASENSDYLIQNKYLWSTSACQTLGISQ